MQQIPPPQLPWHGPEIPARPAVIPILPTRVQQPGRQAPLPDAVAVRRCAVPDSAPPFDTEIPAATRQDAKHPDTGSRVHSGNEPDSPALARPPEVDHGDQDRSEPAAPDGGSSGRQPDGPTGHSGPPDDSEPPRQSGQSGGWPSQFAQVLAETLAGSRPARQLTPWTTEQTRKRIRQLGPMLATDQRPKVRRIMTSAPAADVLEMTAVVGFGPRIRVLALRLEREQTRDYRSGSSRWCCTAIESA
jgi:hypothetical protein